MAKLNKKYLLKISLFFLRKSTDFSTATGSLGLPRWLRGKESACQRRRLRFHPWLGKIPWRRKRQPTPVFSPGEPHGRRSQAGPMGVGKSQTRLGMRTVCLLLSRLVSDRWTRTYREIQPSDLQPATQREVPRPAVSEKVGPRGQLSPGLMNYNLHFNKTLNLLACTLNLRSAGSQSRLLGFTHRPCYLRPWSSCVNLSKAVSPLWLILPALSYPTACDD